MQTLFENKNSGAVFSPCNKHRYQLWRIWDESKPNVLFIMLNPSTADTTEDDPTIRRCIGFTKSWGYGGLMVGNLFSYRSTDPKNLKLNQDEVLDRKHADINNRHILKMWWKCDLTVCAWGNPPIETKSIFPLEGMKQLHYLELTKCGNPKHPLYLRKDLKPTPYEIKRYL